MSVDALIVMLVLIGAVALFVTEKLPVDVVALIVLASLLVLGVVTPTEALSGFSSEATITVAAMFVLSAGLQHSGALHVLGRMFARVRWPWLFAILLLITIAAISAFINNTAAVAVFLPLVLAAAASRKQSASQYLIPLSYAAQMGGVCTLIGTSTNLLVNSMARDLGHPGFGVFDFAPLGLIMMAFGLTYVMLFRHWLLPHHTQAAALTEAYDLGKYITELRVPEESSLVGQSVAEAKLTEKYGVYVLELLRGTEAVWAPRAERLKAGDVLLVRGNWSRLTELRDQAKLELAPEFTLGDELFGETDRVLVETMIAPGSRLAGHSLSALEFQWHYNATVLAMQRRGEVLREKLKDVSLSVGDILLLATPQSEVGTLRSNPNLVVLTERESTAVSPRKVLISIAIMAAAVGSAALGWLPIVASSILGCIALIATRCIDNDEAYQAVDWRVIVLLAGVLPLGIALQKSGIAAAIASTGVDWVGGFGPVAVLAMIYLLTALLTEVMSNNAAAVLITPIAYSTALSLGVSPTPFLVAVMFAASTSFATPVGYQTNTMVYSAGGYRFIDFMKMGIPLNLLFWTLAVIFIPRLFPFTPAP